jgi:hypothetical protein
LALRSRNPEIPGGAAVVLYGYDKESFLKLTLLDMVPQEAIRNTPYLSGGGPSQVWQHIKAEGTRIDVFTYWRIAMFCDRPAQLVAITDVTEQRKAEARIVHMSHYDALTGLPNRVLFHERLDEALLRVRRYAENLAVLYLDLDQFKNVNDTLEHPAGNKLLVAVAERGAPVKQATGFAPPKLVGNAKGASIAQNKAGMGWTRCTYNVPKCRPSKTLSVRPERKISHAVRTLR